MFFYTYIDCRTIIWNKWARFHEIFRIFPMNVLQSQEAAGRRNVETIVNFNAGLAGCCYWLRVSQEIKKMIVPALAELSSSLSSDLVRQIVRDI